MDGDNTPLDPIIYDRRHTSTTFPCIRVRSRSERAAERGEKACQRCGRVRSLDMFTTSGNGVAGRHSWCNPCRADVGRERYRACRT